MMLKGTGIDIVELDRIERLMNGQKRFVERILTPLEQEKWATLPHRRQIEYVAGRFTGKEALAKALGTGIGEHFSWQDVSIVSNHAGAPEVIWHKGMESCQTHISISHSKYYAVAQAILVEN